jgi:hypothetical protein
MSTNEQIKVDQDLTARLRDCPFCKERPVFGPRVKSHGFLLRHWPDKPCPARCEIFCEDFDFARKIWGEIDVVDKKAKLWDLCAAEKRNGEAVPDAVFLINTEFTPTDAERVFDKALEEAAREALSRGEG